MLYLVLTIVSSSMISIVMRISENHIQGKVSMLAANYVTCILLSWMWMGFGDVYPLVEGRTLTLALGVINGIFYVAGLLLMQSNIKRNGVVLPTVFSRLGLLVPLLMSLLVFNEVPTIAQSIGALIALAAIVAIYYDKGQKQDHNQIGSKIMLIYLLLTDGCSTAMAKVYDEVGNSALSMHFLLYTFIAALIFCLVFIGYRKERFGFKEALFGVMIGVPNFFASRFLLKALEQVPAIIVYPTRGVACIVLVSFVGIFLFKERLKKQQWLALGAILISLVLLNS